jgi:hypothetical protein
MSVDLTTITTAYGLLDEETQRRLRAHGGPYEQYTDKGAWAEKLYRDWWVSSTYRVKPVPLTKPSIDWSHVAPQYKWLAQDENGRAWLYSDVAPYYDVGNKYWSSDARPVGARAFSSFQLGTCNWKDSLVERPEGV